MTRSRSNSSSRPESITYVRGAMEGVVLVLVALLPWAFGGVDPLFELVVAVGVALLLLGWAAVACVNGRLSFARCPVTLCLTALFFLGAIQSDPSTALGSETGLAGHRDPECRAFTANSRTTHRFRSADCVKSIATDQRLSPCDSLRFVSLA